MSEQAKQRLEFLAVLLGLALSASAFVKAWMLLPYRVELVEQRVENSERAGIASRELLLRIDERLQAVQRDVADLRRKP